MKQTEDKALLTLPLLGKRIRQLRIKSGFTSQETFAQLAGIPRAQYARHEKGNNLTFLSLYKILAFHNITFRDFFNDEFDRQIAELYNSMKTETVNP